MGKGKKNKVLDPRHYMDLAIEEMNKSKNEPRADGKVPPKVGAVLVFSDGRVETAHRGELRDGDHAEFTLLERKLAHEQLDKCTLYTTLEPCVKRNDPKIACCKRTTKARIKKVYVGIEDPDPTVDGKGIRHLEKHGVKVKMFDRDLQKVIEDENREFIKQAVERKKRAKKVVELNTFEEPAKNYDISKLSTTALKKFLRESDLDYQYDSDEFYDYLADAGVLIFNDEKKSFTPSGFGVLLFGKTPRVTYKQAVLKCTADYGAGKIEPKDFDGPLVLIPDQVEDWLRKVLPSSMDTSHFKREDVSSYPIEIVREAVINAIVHRDYTIEEASSTLEIDQNKILVKSPGSPLPAISMDDLNTFRAPSLRRNPVISFIFSQMDYMEEKGLGMKTFKSLHEQFGLPLPEYSFSDPYLKLVFPRSLKDARQVSERTGLSELNDEELKYYEFIKSNGEITRQEFEENFEISTRTAQRYLKKMLELNLIEKKGSGRNTYYRVKSIE